MGARKLESFEEPAETWWLPGVGRVELPPSAPPWIGGSLPLPVEVPTVAQPESVEAEFDAMSEQLKKERI